MSYFSLSRQNLTSPTGGLFLERNARAISLGHCATLMAGQTTSWRPHKQTRFITGIEISILYTLLNRPPLPCQLRHNELR